MAAFHLIIYGRFWVITEDGSGKQFKFVVMETRCLNVCGCHSSRNEQDFAGRKSRTHLDRGFNSRHDEVGD